MALLRLLSFPSTTHLSSENQSLLTSFSSLNNRNNSIVTTIQHSSFHLLQLTLPQTPITLITTKHTPNFTPRFSQQAEAATESVSTQVQEETVEEFSETRLLAQNVPWTSTPEDIRSLFEKHGRVLEVELSMFNKTRNRGLAFVEMGSPEEARAAFENLESSEFDGRIIKLNYAKPKKKKTPPPVKQPNPITFNLFVANLHYEARAKDLKEFFDAGTGNVVSAEVIFHDNPRKSSGYGFVGFKTKKQADSALVDFQGKVFMGRPIRVARGRQFVKNRVEESERTDEDPSPKLSVNGAEADKAD